MQEIWKPITGYEDRYEVSSLGMVRSYKKSRNGWQILKPRTSKSRGLITGYLRVALQKQNTYKNFCVHKLVAQEFIPNPENKPQVDHIDGDIFNNTLSNLRWVTQKENNNNPIHLTKCRKYYKPVLCKETGVVYKNIYEVIEKLGVSYYSLYACVVEQRINVCGGYHWCFVEKPIDNP